MDAAGASTMFDSIDQNSDGVIDSSEFQEWRINGPQPDRETVIKEWSAWSSDAIDKYRQWDEAVEYAATLTNRCAVKGCAESRCAASNVQVS